MGGLEDSVMACGVTVTRGEFLVDPALVEIRFILAVVGNVVACALQWLLLLVDLGLLAILFMGETVGFLSVLQLTDVGPDESEVSILEGFIAALFQGDWSRSEFLGPVGSSCCCGNQCSPWQSCP